MPLKLQPLYQIKDLCSQLIDAIQEYKNSNTFDETELERALDELLTKLPRDILHVEWFDRSDIENMANGVFDEPVNADMVDKCMESLDRFNGSIMENEIVQDIVADTVRTNK